MSDTSEQPSPNAGLPQPMTPAQTQYRDALAAFGECSYWLDVWQARKNDAGARLQQAQQALNASGGPAQPPSTPVVTPATGAEAPKPRGKGPKAPLSRQ